MTGAGEQFFFRAFAASANVRLSAAATGFTHSAFYQKKKKRPVFAREMRISLSIGYDRIEDTAQLSTSASITLTMTAPSRAILSPPSGPAI